MREFGDFVSVHSADLLRTAYFLTGDRELGSDLLQVTLAKTYLRWHRVQQGDAALTYAGRRW